MTEDSGYRMQSFALSISLIEKLEAQARIKKLSKSDLIRKLIIEYLDKETKKKREVKI